MICGYLPFEGEENKEIFDNILKGVIAFPENVPENVEYIIREMLVAEPNERIVIADIKRSSLYLQGKKLFGSLYGNQTIPTFNIYDRKIALTTPNSDNGECEDNAYVQGTKAKETIVLASKGGNNGVCVSNGNNIKPVKNGFRKKVLQLTTAHNQNRHINMRTDMNLNSNAYHGRFSPITQHVSNGPSNIITMKKLFSLNTKNTHARQHNVHNHNQHRVVFSNVATPNTTPTTTVSNIDSVSHAMVVPKFKSKNSFRKIELKYDSRNPMKSKLGAFYLYKQNNLNQFLSPHKLLTVTNTRGGKSVRRESDVVVTEPNPMFPRFVSTTRKMKSSNRNNSNKLDSEMDRITLNSINNKGVCSTRNNNNLYVFKYTNVNVPRERNHSQEGRNCSTVGNVRVYGGGNGFLPKLI